MTASFHLYNLQFKRPAGTSRGVMNTKETWFLVIEKNGKRGIGECGLLRGLSADDRTDYAEKLQWVCNNINLGEQKLWDLLMDFPSIQFGLEMAFRSLNNQDPMVLFPSDFTSGKARIPINGLVWMGNRDFMLEQISDKIEQGFSCIKLKVGALDFKRELEILHFIRNNFDESKVEIRVDANGGFSATDALYKINQLSEFKIHSIEQPIQPKQFEAMNKLCLESPIPIALDEELIGVSDFSEREKLLQIIQPQYLIFKPSFIGGIRGTNHWISLCEKYGIQWWITSALESNIGLNAIAQYAFDLGVSIPQGLGTGSLYTNNMDSPLIVFKGFLIYDPTIPWGDFPF